MASKRYSAQEANELLPYLAPTLTELRDKFIRASDLRAEVAREAAADGGTSKRRKLQKIQGRVTELFTRLEGWEVELRDIEAGLVDFPAVVDGAPAWLCWKLGEPRVGYWHPTTSGFADRRPL
ncbi:MAG: DUF2203 domain-containing protein [Actinomycetota bacterium]